MTEQKEVFLIIYEGPGDKWHGPHIFFYESAQPALDAIPEYPKHEGKFMYIEGTIVVERQVELAL